NRVLADTDKHVEVAVAAAIGPRLPFPSDSYPCAVIDTGRDVHLQLALPPEPAFPFTVDAGTANDLTAAVALAAGSADGKETLLVDNFSAAPAHGTLSEP